jgi:hypothetical protein
MNEIVKPLRIEPAFDDRAAVRALFDVNAPYGAPDGSDDNEEPVVEAGAVSWFHEGPGGGFHYWPVGPDGPMASEVSPFGNVAIVADNDRMYHRIGRIGDPAAKLQWLGIVYRVYMRAAQATAPSAPAS